MSNVFEPEKCPQCGEVIPAEAPQGLCPKCLLSRASIPTETGAGQTHGHQATGRAAPPRAEDLAKAFPQLEIIELIGQGGMGFVYKARQPRLERLVALKILPQSLAADPAFADRFTREGRLLARLNYPNIVTVHDFGQANGFFYLLMEYVDGVNLRQAMQAGRFTADQALAVVPKICDALQFAHNEGVLHRDIKPENILLDSKGRIKIADFGIAKLLGETAAGPPLTRSGGSLGTPHYMAPEQIERPTAVDHRADIYSLGVVFYEMLTGELPLGRFQPPSQKVQVDVRLDDVVLHALEKEPARRYQKVSEVKTAVTNIVETPSTAFDRRSDTRSTSAKPDLFWRRFALTAGLIVLAMLVIPVLAILAAMILPAISKARAHRAQVTAITTKAGVAANQHGPARAVPRMTLSEEKYKRINREPNELNWGFNGFVPPGHLAAMLFVTWSNGVPTVEKGLSTYFKVGPNGGIDVPFCLVTCYRIAESTEFQKWNGEELEKAAKAWHYPSSAGISNAVRWDVNLGAGYTVSHWIPMPNYKSLSPQLPVVIEDNEQIAFPLVAYEGFSPTQDSPREANVEGSPWSGVDLRILLERFEGPAVRTEPNEKDMTNYIAGRGLPWSEEETYRRLTNSPVRVAPLQLSNP